MGVEGVNTLEEDILESETWELETERLGKGKKRDSGENPVEDKPSRKKRKEKGWRQMESHDWGNKALQDREPEEIDVEAKTNIDTMQDINLASSGRRMPRMELPGKKLLAITYIPGGAVVENGTGAEDRSGATKLTREEEKKSRSRAMGTKEKTQARQKDRKNTPSVARKVYKQGLRRIRQDIETGIQPMIFQFLNDKHREEQVQGGQPPQPGGDGGGCVPSPVRKRSCPSQFNSPSKRKTKK